MVLLDSSNNIPKINIQIFPYHMYSGIINMSVDHYFASTCEKEFDPILRFYGWQPYCLSLGYHQSTQIIDIEMLKDDNYDWVRRPTGGRAIFHSQELTYSIIFPKNLFSHKYIYSFIHELFTNVLNKFGYNVILSKNNVKLPKIVDSAEDYPCFTKSAETEVEYDGKKLIGSAQKIYENSILQHGSILIGNMHKKLSKYLKTKHNERNNIDDEINLKTICLNSIIDREMTPEILEKETIKQLESINNISLIFNNLENNNIRKALIFNKDKK